MVVGERYAVHAEQIEHLGRHWRSAEEEGLLRIWPGRPPGRDAALQIHDGEIGLAAGGNDLLGEHLLWTLAHENLGDAATQHCVACKRQLHDTPIDFAEGPVASVAPPSPTRFSR